MIKYIAFLRAINVGGNRKVEMTKLKMVFEDLGYKNVKTILNTGNVIFEASEGIVSKLRYGIENKLKQTFGFEIPTIIRTPNEIANIIQNNPYIESSDNNVRVYIGFIEPKPKKIGINALKSLESSIEKVEITDIAVYIWTDKSDPKSRFILENKQIEQKLGVISTTRNPRTLERILNHIN